MKKEEVQIPFELLSQVGCLENFNNLNREQKLKEISDCIISCIVNMEEHPEIYTYFKSQLVKLEKFEEYIRNKE